MSRIAPLLMTAVAAATLSLTACTGGDGETPADSSSAVPAETSAAGTSTSPSASATPGDTGDGPALPEQTIGAAPDCSPWTFESLGVIWGTTFTDTDEGQVIEVNGPGTFRYSCDYNETDSGLGLTVIVEVKEYLTADEAVQSMNDTRAGASFGDSVYYLIEDVAGVGDEAFFSVDADDETNPNPVQVQMYARYSNVVFLVTALNLDGLPSADGAKDGLVTTLTGAVG